MSNFIEKISDEKLLELSMVISSFQREFWFSDNDSSRIGYLKVVPSLPTTGYLKIDDDYYVLVKASPIQIQIILENETTISPIGYEVFEELKVAEQVYCGSMTRGFYIRW